MKIQGALIKEQGVTFAIVVVKKHVVDNRSQASDAISAFGPIFPEVPIVLMAQDSGGTPIYFGRPDLVKFLVSVPPHTIPWREYTVD